MALIFKMTHCNEHCWASRLETIHMRQRCDKCAQFQIMLIVNWDSTLNIPAHRTQITYVKLSVTLVIAWINHKYQDCNNLKISIRRKCVFVTLEFGFRNICDYFPKFWNSCSWSIYQIEWKTREREKTHIRTQIHLAVGGSIMPFYRSVWHAVLCTLPPSANWLTFVVYLQMLPLSCMHGTMLQSTHHTNYTIIVECYHI